MIFSLKEIDIDLNKIYKKYKVILDDPLSIDLNRRSINKLSPAKIISEESIFLHFIDKELTSRLEKIYTKTIQSDDTSVNNSDKIIKIRNYIQKKYSYMNLPQKQYEIKLQLDEGEEFDLLYNIWIQRGKRVLTVNYFIKYNNSDSIDDGGLTKQFFTNLIQQIQDRFFEQIEGSDRHVFKFDVVTTDTAQFIGHILLLMIMKGYKIDFNISYFYLAMLMFNKEHLTDEEMFIYYLQDVDSIKRNSHIIACSDETMYTDLCDVPIILQNNFDIVYHYNAHKSIFKAFSRGFTIPKKMFYTKFNNINDKIRIYDMDKLITQTEFTTDILKRDIFDQIRLDESMHGNKVYKYFKEIMLGTGGSRSYKAEYNELYKGFDITMIGNDQVAYKEYEKLESDYEFKKNVLMFWSGSKGIVQNPPYKVIILSSIDFPKAHTCFNQLDLPLPDKISSKQELFNILMKLFIVNANKIFTDR